MDSLAPAGAVFWPDYWGNGCKDFSIGDKFGLAGGPEHVFYKERFAGLHFVVRKTTLDV